MMTDTKFLRIAKCLVADYTNDHTDVTDNVTPLSDDDVYVVWYCKTLQNFKGLFSTPRPDGMYYEVTYNGDANEVYFDAYKKFENQKVIV